MPLAQEINARATRPPALSTIVIASVLLAAASCWVIPTVISGEKRPRYFTLVSGHLIGYQPYRSLYERYVPYSDFSRLRLTPATEVALSAVWEIES